jgi:hypothetical protein
MIRASLPQAFSDGRELLSYGCELAQGYYFGHPQSAADIEAQWLEPAAIRSSRRAARAAPA